MIVNDTNRRASLSPVLSWAIVIVLAVIVAGIAATPLVPAGVRFVPAFSAAVGFFECTRHRACGS